MPFEESWRPSEGWKVAPHHHRGADSFYAERLGEPWDQLAISCVMRDRHFVKNWRRITQPGRGISSQGQPRGHRNSLDVCCGPKQKERNL